MATAVVVRQERQLRMHEGEMKPIRPSKYEGLRGRGHAIRWRKQLAASGFHRDGVITINSSRALPWQATKDQNMRIVPGDGREARRRLDYVIGFLFVLRSLSTRRHMGPEV